MHFVATVAPLTKKARFLRKLCALTPVTIPLSQMYFYGQYNQQWNLIMAGFVVSTIPVVLFFLLMQKHIINGIAAGAVKG